MAASLFHGIDIAARKTPRKIILEDALGQTLTYRQMILKSLGLANCLRRFLPKNEAIGLALPNTVAFVMSFLALQALGRTTAILNTTTGSRGLFSSLHTAGIKTILTSRTFLGKAGLVDVFETLSQAGYRLIYLEDLREQISFTDKLWALVGTYGKRSPPSQEERAVILFTSGSEGEPKGVVLSHNNLLCNAAQVKERISFSREDVLFSSLPFFHGFGLLAGLVLPLLHGVKSYIVPSPLAYKDIPKQIETSQATILFSTNTFLKGYAKHGSRKFLGHLKAIYAGAEALQEDTRDLYAREFGVPVYQGYGVTEASPVIAVNVAEAHTPGSVGRPLEGLEIKIMPEDGFPEGGRLFVKGPNMMMGYYLPAAPRELKPPFEGWHDTGDIVRADPAGYLFILGRAKRFAKIGGETISLGAIEKALAEKWTKAQHAVISRPHPTKGEEIVVITTHPSLSLEEVQGFLLTQGFPRLSLPKAVVFRESLPLLGSGKVDYPEIINHFSRDLCDTE